MALDPSNSSSLEQLALKGLSVCFRCWTRRHQRVLGVQRSAAPLWSRDQGCLLVTGARSCLCFGSDRSTSGRKWSAVRRQEFSFGGCGPGRGRRSSLQTLSIHIFTVETIKKLKITNNSPPDSWPVCFTVGVSDIWGLNPLFYPKPGAVTLLVIVSGPKSVTQLG